MNATRTLTNTNWGITAGLTTSLVIILISLLLTYCFRDHMRVFLHNNFDFLKRRRRELDVLYDVRVIYDETDERIRQWIVGDMLHVLEAEWGLVVFLVKRDMLAGGVMPKKLYSRSARAGEHWQWCRGILLKMNRHNLHFKRHSNSKQKITYTEFEW